VAIDAGINFIDTADVYSRWVEEILGAFLRLSSVIGSGNPKSRAHQLVLATKCGRTGTGPNDEGLSRKHIMAAVDITHTPGDRLYRSLSGSFLIPLHR
jgi:aryl-alcohol dehydrogenase-like predicted oxidoreductase